MTLRPKWRKRLTILTYVLIALTIGAIILTLAQWWLVERSFEPLNVLTFSILSILTLISSWLNRQNQATPLESDTDKLVETFELGPLRQQISQYFNLDELYTLCVDLGVRYDDLRGDTLGAKVASLVEHVERQGRLLHLLARLEQERPTVTWSITQRYLHNRQNLLQNVQSTWIDGYLKQSLHNTVALELNLVYQPEAIVRKILQVAGQQERDVEQPILDVFSAYGRSLLILGEPGSGKTITLLQLAEALIAEAHQDHNQPIPVVLNLASWADQKWPLEKWLTEELFVQYQVSKVLGFRSIRNNQLLYLLDGLDEVAGEVREDCIAAINNFKAHFVADIVVCSRIRDYEALKNRLNLGVAVRIEPLTKTQIYNYLERDELQLRAVKTTLATDPALYTLAQTPLFLSIMTLAYRGLSIDKLRAFNTLEARRHHLLQMYVERMFERRPLNRGYLYTQKEALHWMENLALSLQQHAQTIFYIERLQPSWLPPHSRHYYTVLVGIIAGLIGGSIFGLSTWFTVSPMAGLIIGFIGSLSVGIIGQRKAQREAIILVEELRWTPPPAKQMLRYVARGGLAFGLPIGVSFGLILGLLLGVVLGAETGLTVGVGLVLSGVIVGGLLSGLTQSISTREMQQRPRPNQGIRNSQRNALTMGIVLGLVFGISIGTVSGLILGLLFGTVLGLGIGLIVGLSGGLSGGLMEYGGQTVVRHYSVRWLLARQNILPFAFRDQSLVTFLDDMATRILLRRVGGGWVFIHRMLLDHFASLRPE